jgi:hypothetical protein
MANGVQPVLTVLLRAGRAGAFLETCAAESRTRADILFASLALQQVLSGDRAVGSGLAELGLGPAETAALAAAQGLWDTRSAKLIARRVVSRAGVQAHSEQALEAVAVHGARLAAVTDPVGRTPLHCLLATWHAPVVEVGAAAAAAGLLSSRGAALEGGTEDGARGVAALDAHYSAMRRAVAAVTAAAAGRLPVPVLDEGTTPLQWRASHVTAGEPMGYVAASAEDAGGVTDADTVPMPGVMLIRAFASPESAAGLGKLLAAVGAGATVADCAARVAECQAGHASVLAALGLGATLPSGADVRDVLPSSCAGWV